MDIKIRKKGISNAPSALLAPRTRKDVHQEAKQKLMNITSQKMLPKDFNGVIVHNFGFIDPRAAFHTYKYI
jgi:hypothetical protein